MWSEMNRSVMNRSVIHVVCYECPRLWSWSVMSVVCNERVCNDCVLLWTWRVMNGCVVNVVCYERGLLWTWSVMNVISNERVCDECGLLWTCSSMNIGVREGILLGGRKKFALRITICPASNFFSLIRMGPETSCKSVLYSWIRL